MIWLFIWTRGISIYGILIIKTSGLSLGIMKCEFAKSEYKFISHITGLGYWQTDPEKVRAIQQLRQPKTVKNKFFKS
jgi:hypothetical protein